MLFSKACDITGIVGIACARHGCFAPNSIVDLFRGEQQKNVDWSLLESIRTTGVHPDQGMMLIYDIACQYHIHLNDRIGHLLPIELEIDRAIGLFHVHAHKEECFYQFASTFIPGSGIVAGEILESLWSRLNAISTATQTATLAHRAEVIDDHASDSNHKKALGIGKTPVIWCNGIKGIFTSTGAVRSVCKGKGHGTENLRLLQQAFFYDFSDITKDMGETNFVGRETPIGRSIGNGYNRCPRN